MKFRRLEVPEKCAEFIYLFLMGILIEERYIDGIYSYQNNPMFTSNSFLETREKLTKILQVLSKYNLTITPNPHSFYRTGVDCLGFHIGNHLISPISSNICKINSFLNQQLLAI